MTALRGPYGSDRFTCSPTGRWRLVQVDCLASSRASPDFALPGRVNIRWTDGIRTEARILDWKVYAALAYARERARTASYGTRRTHASDRTTGKSDGG